MTKVDFYILSDSGAVARSHFACRLADKAFNAGHRVYIHTSDEASAAALDEQLWTFRPQSFLPHGRLGSENAELVGIGYGDDPAEHNDVMINLDLAVPDFVGRFSRVLEVVVPDPQLRDPLRENYRFYADRGYPLTNKRL